MSKKQPPVAARERRDRHVGFVVTEKEKSELEHWQRLNGFSSLGEFIRQQLKHLLGPNNKEKR
jgi:hypothetical protein